MFDMINLYLFSVYNVITFIVLVERRIIAVVKSSSVLRAVVVRQVRPPPVHEGWAVRGYMGFPVLSRNIPGLTKGMP